MSQSQDSCIAMRQSGGDGVLAAEHAGNSRQGRHVPHLVCHVPVTRFLHRHEAVRDAPFQSVFATRVPTKGSWGAPHRFGMYSPDAYSEAGTSDSSGDGNLVKTHQKVHSGFQDSPWYSNNMSGGATPSHYNPRDPVAHTSTNSEDQAPQNQNSNLSKTVDLKSTSPPPAFCGKDSFTSENECSRLKAPSSKDSQSSGGLLTHSSAHTQDGKASSDSKEPSSSGGIHSGNYTPKNDSFTDKPNCSKPIHSGNTSPEKDSATKKPGYFNSIHSGNNTPEKDSVAEKPRYSKSIHSGNNTSEKESGTEKPGYSNSIHSGNNTPEKDSVAEKPMYSKSIHSGNNTSEMNSVTEKPGYSNSIHSGNKTSEKESGTEKPGYSNSIHSGNNTPEKDSVTEKPGYSNSIHSGNNTSEMNSVTEKPGYSNSIHSGNNTSEKDSVTEKPGYSNSIHSGNNTSEKDSVTVKPVSSKSIVTANPLTEAIRSKLIEGMAVNLAKLSSSSNPRSCVHPAADSRTNTLLSSSSSSLSVSAATSSMAKGTASKSFECQSSQSDLAGVEKTPKNSEKSAMTKAIVPRSKGGEEGGMQLKDDEFNPKNFYAVRVKIQEGNYNSVEQFSEDMVRIIQWILS